MECGVLCGEAYEIFVELDVTAAAGCFFGRPTVIDQKNTLG